MTGGTPVTRGTPMTWGTLGTLPRTGGDTATPTGVAPVTTDPPINALNGAAATDGPKPAAIRPKTARGGGGATRQPREAMIGWKLTSITQWAG